MGGCNNEVAALQSVHYTEVSLYYHPQLLCYQQGDPLGPLEFALTSPFGGKNQGISSAQCVVLGRWTLCGSLRDLSAAFDIIEDVGPCCGLHLI